MLKKILLAGSLLMAAYQVGLSQRLEVGLSYQSYNPVYELNFSSLDRFTQRFADFNNFTIYLTDIDLTGSIWTNFQYGIFAHYHFKNRFILRAELMSNAQFGGKATFEAYDDLVFPEGDIFEYEDPFLLGGVKSSLGLITKLVEGKNLTPILLIGLTHQRNLTLIDDPSLLNNPYAIALRPFQTIAPNIWYGRIGVGYSFFEFPIIVHYERNLTPTDIDNDGTFLGIYSITINASIQLLKFNLQSNKNKKRLKNLNRQF